MVRYCRSHKRILTDVGWRSMTEEEVLEVKGHLFAKRVDCDHCPVDDYGPRNYEATYTFVRKGIWIRQEGLRDEPADIPEAMLLEEPKPLEKTKPERRKNTIMGGLKKGAKKAARKVARQFMSKDKEEEEEDNNKT